jgi:hypothetical protein
MLLDDVEDHALNRGFLIAIQLFKLFIREGRARYSFSIGDESVAKVGIIAAVNVFNLRCAPINKGIVETLAALIRIIFVSESDKFISLIAERETMGRADFKAGGINAFNGVWFHDKGRVEGKENAASYFFAKISFKLFSLGNHLLT